MWEDNVSDMYLENQPTTPTDCVIVGGRGYTSVQCTSASLTRAVKGQVSRLGQGSVERAPMGNRGGSGMC